MSERSAAGLRGIRAGETAICTVGEGHSGLRYRGYDIGDLAQHASFEEVAYLLLYGELPTAGELARYTERLQARRDLPGALRAVLERIPASAHPMDVMRTGCSMLGTLEPEEDFGRQHEIADRLLALFPPMLLYWHHFSTAGRRVDTQSSEASIAGHLLHLLHGKAPTETRRRALDVSLILYAEHEFNASTFTARVCAATLSDLYSAVTGAIGSLRGTLHGGANEAAMALIERFATPQEAVAGVKEMLARKEKIMGFGHAIYREADPRSALIKEWSRRLAQECGDPDGLFAISEAIQGLMWEERRLFDNLDFFCASTYRFLGIPTTLFTPIFVCARITGWAAHIMEQRANNRLIRPSAAYVGPGRRAWVPIKARDRSDSR